MSGDNEQSWSYSVRSLESGIRYETLDASPDEPLLIEMIGIQPERLPELATRFNIDLEDLQDIMDLDERPRVQIEEDFAMLVLRVPVDLTIKDRDYSTYPVGLFTDGDSLVIMKHAEIPIRQRRLKRISKSLMTPPEIIYNLWEVVIHSFETTLDIIEATIKHAEESIQTEIYPTRLSEFFRLSSDAVYMEAALQANMRVLRHLIRNPRFGHVVLNVERLEELEVDLQQQLELSSIYRELIDNAMNAYDMIVGHNLNQVMKTLTSISLIVSVPTLIASIYGMNVGLPLQNEPGAFIFLLLFSFFITLPVLAVLRIKRLV